MTLPYCDGPEFTCLDRMIDMPDLPRYQVICVPGQLDDGSDAHWFVADSETKKSKRVGCGEPARVAAFREARRLNGASK